MLTGRSIKATAIFMTLVLALLAAVLSAMPADAGGRSWSRGGSATGPGGRTATWQRSGHCEGGDCTRSGTFTGPAGYTRSYERSRECAGGTCSFTGSYTGRGGNTWTRSGSVTVD
ncbi:MAG: hypothetical protein AB7S70_05455 [Hyphomicrobium sp.]|uniref:hypothetical protein n=1 Tax=Hyphomicrobium sp. TaxID=82 RepID=UPI003D0EC12E